MVDYGEYIRTDIDTYGWSFLDLVSRLVSLGLEVTMCYDRIEDKPYFNLNTGAKSNLHLYYDGSFKMRYDRTGNVYKEQNLYDAIDEVYSLFTIAMHGRDFFNLEWVNVGEYLGRI